MRTTTVDIKKLIEITDDEGTVIKKYKNMEQVEGILIPNGNELVSKSFGLTAESTHTFVYKNPLENDLLKVGNKINELYIIEAVYYPGKATICGLKGV